MVSILIVFVDVRSVDVVPEEGGGQVIETDEVAGRHVAGVGHIIALRTGIVPQQDIVMGCLSSVVASVCVHQLSVLMPL